MSNNPTSRPKPPRRSAAAEQRRRMAQQRARRRTVAWAAVAVAVVVIAVVALAGSGGGPSDEAAAPAGTEMFEDLSRNHVPGPVSYEQTPPVGGDHNRVWQNCGFYPDPITAEMGVHSMEHGAVWVTYRPDVPADQKQTLERLADDQTYVLVSPWADGLPSPVVASAWGRQLRLPGANDARLAEFVRAFRQGPQTPEPGAPCTGGESGMG